MVAGCLLYSISICCYRDDGTLTSTYPHPSLLTCSTLEEFWRPLKKGLTLAQNASQFNFLGTANTSVPVLIARRIPIVIVPPMVTILLGVKNKAYRRHYSSALEALMGMDNTLADKALAAFTCAGTALSVFRTDPCLFQRYKTYSIEDYSLAQGNCYPSQEGARMVGLTKEALQCTERTKAHKRKANVTDGASPLSSVLKRQTTLTQSAKGQLGLQLPFEHTKVSDGFFQPKVVTIAQLKANRTALQQFNKALQQFNKAPNE